MFTFQYYLYISCENKRLVEKQISNTALFPNLSKNRVYPLSEAMRVVISNTEENF